MPQVFLPVYEGCDIYGSSQDASVGFWGVGTVNRTFQHFSE